MAVTTKHTFNAVGSGGQGTTTFTIPSIQLNNQDDLDVYVTKASAGISANNNLRIKHYRQNTSSNLDANHVQVNDTTGLYFPALTHTGGTETLENYTINSTNTTITFNSALPSGAVVSIERRTRDSSSNYTTFAGGSTIRSTQLNDAFDESNFTAQEARNKAFEIEGKIFGTGATSTSFISSDEIIDGTIVGADIASDTITASNLAPNSVAASELADDAVDTDAIQDNAVTMAKLNSGVLPTDITVASANIVDGTIVNADINNSANIQGTKLADDSVTLAKLGSGALPTDITVASANIVNGTIVDADVASGAAIAHTKLSGAAAGKVLLGNSSNVVTATTLSGDITVNSSGVTALGTDVVTSGKIGDDAVGVRHLADDSVATAAIQTNAVTATELADNAVDRNAIVNDAVNGDKIADNSIDSDHYVDGSIDTAHIAAGAVNSTQIAGGAIDLGHMSANSVDSDQYVDGSIDRVHIAGLAISADKIDDNTIINSKIAANTIEASSLQNGCVSANKLNASLVVTASEQAAHSVDDETFFTTSAAEARYFNASTGETIKDGQTFPDNDTTIATTAAINDRIIDLVDKVGGFVPIANETSFPNANPDIENGTGTIVSIGELASNHTSNGSGVITISNGTVGNSTVTITGAANSTTYSAGYGLLVETTTTLNTYTFHRLTTKATEVTTVAGSISNVNTVAGSISNVNAVAGNASNINAVAADATDIGVVAGKATEIGRLGTADAVSDLNTLGTTAIVSDLDTLADISSNITTVAGISGNVTTVAGISSNVTTVAGIHGNVTTVAGNNSNVTTVAGNISDVNNFADLYQIANSNPSTDGGGNALAEGDLYFNTSANELKVYNGSAWQGGVTASGNFASTTGNTFTGNNIYNDGVHAKFGTGSDLAIYHYDNHNYIDSANGRIYLRHGTDAAIVTYPNAQVELYYDNVKKFETTSSGVWVTGNVTVVGDLLLDEGDNKRIRLGDSQDLQLYHNGTDSFITHDTGANGSLVIKSTTAAGAPHGLYLDSDFTGLRNEAQDEYYLKATNGGAVELYFDNSKKFETTSTGVDVTGTLTIDAVPGTNTNAALGVLYQTSSGAIDGGSGLTYDPGGNTLSVGGNHISINTFRGNGALGTLTCDNHSSTTAVAVSNTIDIKTIDNTAGAFKLVEGSNEIITVDTTNSSELIKFGTAGTTRMTIAGANIDLPDSQKMRFGNGADLEIYHVSNGYIDNNTNHLYVRNNVDGDDGGNIYIQAKSGEHSIICNDDGVVELYKDGGKSLQTDTNGIVVYASEGGSCNVWLYADEGDDNADQWRIQASNNGSFYLDNYTSGSWENSLSATGNGATKLYYDNAVKFETTSTGATITGLCNVAGGSTESPVTVSTSNDYVGKFESTDAAARLIVEDSASTANHNGLQVSGDTCMLVAGNAFSVKGIGGGATELNHNGNKKFETTSDGVKVSSASNDAKLNIVSTNQDGAPVLQFTADNGDDNNDYWRIRADGSGNALGIQNYADGAWESNFVGRESGGAELYYDNSKKFETTSYGAKVEGILRVDDSGSGGANNAIYVGSSDDLKIFHDGSNTYLDNFEGNYNVRLITGGDHTPGSGTYHTAIRALPDGATELYHDGTKRINTHSNGAEFHGTMVKQTGTGATYMAIGSTNAGGATLYLDGDSNGDFAGSDYSSISHTTGGDIVITCDSPGQDSNFYVYHNTSGGSETGIYSGANGAVQLYYDGSKKFETTSSGVTVTGSVTCDGLSIGDNEVINIGASNDLRLYHDNGNNYVGSYTNQSLIFTTNNSSRWQIASGGTFKPIADNSYDIGSTSYRVANIYTADLHCSNRGSKNDVDGTWGDYTIQEGENDLFLINRRNGKKYKFNLTEVS